MGLRTLQVKVNAVLSCLYVFINNLACASVFSGIDFMRIGVL